MASHELPSGLDDSRVLHLANRLHSAAIHLLRWARTVDRQSGLSPERLSILSVLTFGGPKTVTELAEAELVSPPAISRILNGLEDDALVARERSSEDRRVVRVHVTKAGKRVIDEARARRLERIASRLGRLSEKELRVLAAATEVLESLEEGHARE
jgi:DNA-binding MarR family transcriptional regulator